MTPTIEASRVRLVAFERRHLNDRYLSWLSDPEVTRFSELRHRRHTISSCLEYYEFMNNGGHFFWAIEAEEGLHIGNLSAIIDHNNGVADLSILIGHKPAWGCGCGSEAWKAACRYLLTDGGMRKVRAGTMACNRPMRAVMRSAGMVADGVQRRQLVLDGEEVDVVFAALFREMIGRAPKERELSVDGSN